jgi:hypothetical protein
MKSHNDLLRFFRIIPIAWFLLAVFSCGDRPAGGKIHPDSKQSGSTLDSPSDLDDSQLVPALLISPKNPKPGEPFRVLAVGNKSILKANIRISSMEEKPLHSKSGEGLPFWRIEEYQGLPEGNYKISLQSAQVDFKVSGVPVPTASSGVWSAEKGWDSSTEELYSAWINALFYEADERSSWTALHEVTRNSERNFLYNYLSLNEDNPNEKVSVIMQPDCADNPFYLRAYFAWKLGLPFGYHECDRGYLGKAPGTGRWVTNEANISGSTPVRKFNTFARMVMNGVHSGTARTLFGNENSDYYPVPLTAEALRPGVVFADPYGHTLVLVRRIAQTENSPGVLLSVDAQPDGTVGIKRFWKGNFLFTTSDVIGEPGFKAFRPIVLNNGHPLLLSSDQLTGNEGFLPFSTQQKGMEGNIFYHTMERVINPNPLNPEAAMLDLIQALYEQLTVRITSVSNGEEYMRSHPGEVIAMPGTPAGVFQAGGQWENFSTPNRDLRLLIAMDAVLDFPDKIVRSPGDYNLPLLKSPEQVRERLLELLNQKLSELTITYKRTNGVDQVLTMGEILKRRDSFEMAYNPNDGVEIRWGAPEGSEERLGCKRKVPANQLARMNAVRVWFNKRLHPPT